MLTEILAIILSIFVLILVFGLIRGVRFYILLKKDTSIWEFIMWDVDIYYNAVKPLRNQLIVLISAILFFTIIIFIFLGVGPIENYIALKEGKEVSFLIFIILGFISGLLTLSKTHSLINYLQSRLFNKSEESRGDDKDVRGQ